MVIEAVEEAEGPGRGLEGRGHAGDPRRREELRDVLEVALREREGVAWASLADLVQQPGEVRGIL